AIQVRTSASRTVRPNELSGFFAVIFLPDGGAPLDSGFARRLCSMISLICEPSKLSYSSKAFAIAPSLSRSAMASSCQVDRHHQTISARAGQSAPKWLGCVREHRHCPVHWKRAVDAGGTSCKLVAPLLAGKP